MATPKVIPTHTHPQDPRHTPQRSKRRSPAAPTENPIHKAIRELGEKGDEIRRQIQNLEREEIRIGLQRAIAQGIVDPLPEITITPEETQAVAAHLYWSEGLCFAAQNAVSALRGVMEIVHDEADSHDLGGPKAKHGEIDLWNSYSPLHGAIETLDLLAHRLIAISNRVDLAESGLPDRLRETKKAAEELFASDFGE